MKLFAHHWLRTLLILLFAAAWTAMSAAPDGETSSGRIPAPRQGFPAPDFSLSTPDGETITLSSLRGRPLLINLWASWCPPCRAEMPAMQQVYEKYKDEGFLVLAINATYQDSPSQAVAFAADYGLTYPILLDVSGEVSERYRLRSLPTTFFVDPDGIIREVVVGGPMSAALLEIRVEQLFEEPR